MRIVVKGAMKDYFGVDVLEVEHDGIKGHRMPLSLFNTSLWTRLETPAERMLAIIHNYHATQSDENDITDEGLAEYLIEYGVMLPLKAGDIKEGETIEFDLPTDTRLERLIDEMNKRSLVHDISGLHLVCGSWAVLLANCQKALVMQYMKDWDKAREWPLITSWIRKLLEIGL